MSAETRRNDIIRSAIALTGCVSAALGLSLIWLARSRVDRPVYVSGLGADGEPTAALFEVALLFVVTGGACVAWAGRGIRSTLPLLGAWSVSTSVWVAAGLFFVASQVPCTAGCPVPGGPAATPQDTVHTGTAVVAFAATCVAMLQAASGAKGRALRLLSVVCGLAVAVIAATGGILSLVGVATDLGAVLELVTTSISISWLVLFGVVASSPVGHLARTGDRAPRPRMTAKASA